MGAGLVLGGELHRGRNGAAGEVDFALAGIGQTLDPSAPEVVELARDLAGRSRPTRAPSFGAARNGDAGATRRSRRARSRAGSRSTSPPIAAVADVELVVLGGGIGANGDLLLDPVARLLGDWLPFPPRVEVSTLGEAAVLTGALAVGLQAALENVFSKRTAVPA